MISRAKLRGKPLDSDCKQAHGDAMYGESREVVRKEDRLYRRNRLGT